MSVEAAVQICFNYLNAGQSIGSSKIRYHNFRESDTWGEWNTNTTLEGVEAKIEETALKKGPLTWGDLQGV